MMLTKTKIKPIRTEKKRSFELIEVKDRGVFVVEQEHRFLFVPIIPCQLKVPFMVQGTKEAHMLSQNEIQYVLFRTEEFTFAILALIDLIAYRAQESLVRWHAHANKTHAAIHAMSIGKATKRILFVWVKDRSWETRITTSHGACAFS